MEEQMKRQKLAIALIGLLMLTASFVLGGALSPEPSQSKVITIVLPYPYEEDMYVPIPKGSLNNPENFMTEQEFEQFQVDRLSGSLEELMKDLLITPGEEI
jgi:hypothetical protein